MAELCMELAWRLQRQLAQQTVHSIVVGVMFLTSAGCLNKLRYFSVCTAAALTEYMHKD